ncbi:MAG: glycosyltransferase family 2 protein, partial [Vicinamibacteria bacterium]
ADMVGRVVRDILREAPGFDVVVVDDGSNDATGAVAAGEGAVVITHPYNLGIGGAVQSGYKYALRRGYDVAVQVDGDGQHKPEYLPELLEALQTTGDEADMVCGSRFRGDPGYKVPFGRRLGNMIFSVVLSTLTRQKITDPTSGFRMTNRRGIELFARDYPHDYPEVEALLMLHAHHLRLHEVPVRMNARGFGSSSIDYPRSAYYMAKVMLALFVGLFRRRPTPVEATGKDEPGVGPPAED